MLKFKVDGKIYVTLSGKKDIIKVDSYVYANRECTVLGTLQTFTIGANYDTILRATADVFEVLDNPQGLLYKTTYDFSPEMLEPTYDVCANCKIDSNV